MLIIGPGMVLGHFIFILFRYGFKLVFLPIPSNVEPLDARGAAGSTFKKQITTKNMKKRFKIKLLSPVTVDAFFENVAGEPLHLWYGHGRTGLAAAAAQRRLAVHQKPAAA